MELLYLLHRQQVERSRADNALCDEARRAHRQLAALYETAIEEITGGNFSFRGEPKSMGAQSRPYEPGRLTGTCSATQVSNAAAYPY